MNRWWIVAVAALSLSGLSTSTARAGFHRRLQPAADERTSRSART